MSAFPTYSGSLAEAVPERVAAFDSYFSRDTGADPELGWFRLRYWDYIKKLRAIPDFRAILDDFHFDFVDDARLNATACSVGGTHLIGINRGAVHNLRLFYTAALSHPGVLPEVGDPSLETQWFSSLSRCRWMDPVETVFAAIERIADPPAHVTADPVRRFYAHRLVIFALDLIFFHELGHHWGKHLEFLGHESGVAAVDEAGTAADAKHPPLDYQALEIDADARAFQVLAGSWRNLADGVPPGSLFTSVDDAVETYVVAMGTVFLMFDQGFNTLSEYRGAVHPHPAVRLLNVYHTACTLAEMQSPSLLAIVQKGWRLGMDRAIGLFETLGMNSAVFYQAEREPDALDAEYIRVLDRAKEIGQALYPEWNEG